MSYTKSQRSRLGQESTAKAATGIKDYLLKISTRQCTMKKIQEDLQMHSRDMSNGVMLLMELGAMEKEKFGSMTLVKLTNDKPAIPTKFETN